MKETRLHINVSIFDVLMDREKAIHSHAGKEELVTILGNRWYKQRFPIYFTSLSKKFYAKVEKQRLRKSASETLSNLFQFNHPLHIVNQKIISYMRDIDFRYLDI